MTLLRAYAFHELQVDGYPIAWREINASICEQAGHRCERCGHPYSKGTHGNGEWSPCDLRCTHGGPVRAYGPISGVHEFPGATTSQVSLLLTTASRAVEARWRILTVHHLDGDKANCRWWNLAALCQRDHLHIQGKVRMDRSWPWPHTEWFRPHAAGFYALKYLGQDLTREETMARADELLEMGMREEAVERMPL